MSNLEKKKQNLNQLIDKLNSISLSYSQPRHEIEKIKSERNELANKKKELEKQNQELMREHKYLRDKIQKRKDESKKEIDSRGRDKRSKIFNLKIFMP